MTKDNNGLEPFRKAADGLKPTPKDSSWDRLETMLENKSLAQENKSYKKLIRWISGSAALLLLTAVAAFFYYSNDKAEPSPQFAYQIEPLENLESTEIDLYDIDKLSQLNDPALWVNIVEGGPKPQVNKVFEN